MNNSEILIIAGEASGDLYGAQLIRALRQKNPALKIYAMGGVQMQQAGAEIICDISELAVIGFLEVLKNFGKFKEAFKKTLAFIKTTPPQAIVLIDFPGFNLRLAKRINNTIPVIYYISPQVWAWGENRLKIIKRYIVKMIVIFKFEKTFYESHGINAEYVGHPLLELMPAQATPEEFLKKCGRQKNNLTLGLLPGSRLGEIKKILPLFIASSRLIKNILPDVQFILIKAPTVSDEALAWYIAASGINITIIKEDRYAAIKNCDLVLVCSGTATVETAMLGVPMIIVYKTSFLTWLFSKLLIRVKFIGMVNIVAGKKIAKELIQYQATPEKISREALFLLQNATARLNLTRDLSQLKHNFYPSQAAEKTAGLILPYLTK